MLRIGVIGYGYWGPNIVRNFNRVEGAHVTMICDGNETALQSAKKDCPNTEFVKNSDDVTRSSKIDVVAVVTPVSTHYDLAKKALLDGKHVFVEKPFTATVEQAGELIALAEKNNLKIMVDHTFLFTGAVTKIKETIDNNTLGNIYYYDSTRVNLGLFQHDVNVIWDLATHDFSIMDFVIKEKPVALAASGQAHVNGKEDIAYITVYLTNKMIAHFNVNWLSPVKVRNTLIGGEKKMLVWNDVNVDEKIKIYDKGIDVSNREGIHNRLVSYRSGDIWTPKVEQKEALAIEAEYFIDCIVNDKQPINDGYAGLRIVKMLEACNRSLKDSGKLINL